MPYSLFSFKSSDDRELKAYVWPVENPIAILQLVHGMMEYSARYNHFAEWLAERGIAVYSCDHSGHGLSASSPEDLGYFDRRGGWKKVVRDVRDFTSLIKTKNPGLPVFLLGHSMGSILARDYMIRFGPEVDGYILSGTLEQPCLIGYFGIALAECLQFIKGPKHRGRIFTNLGYGRYNSSFKPVRTDFDWLCSDPEIVDRYISDPLCGKPSTVSFYKDFLKGSLFVGQMHNIRKILPQIPVLLFSGEQDPVGNFGRTVHQVEWKFRRAGLINISVKIYPTGRHEMLNEKNREKVYEDVYNWISSVHKKIEPDTWID